MKGIASCNNYVNQTGEELLHFLCPKDGLLHQDCIDFLCNTCGTKELIYQSGMYICPDCLTKPSGFRCRICGSREIVIQTEAKGEYGENS